MVQVECFKRAQIKLSSLILLVSLFSSFSSFAEDAALEIEKATYKAEDEELTIVVKRENKNSTTIRLFDNVTNKILTEKHSSDDEIKIKIEDIREGNVPCSVRVELDGLSTSRNVNKAPSNCSQYSSVPAGTTEDDAANTGFEIEKATYKDEDEKLIIKVKRKTENSTTITVFDKITNQVLAEKQSSDTDTEFKIKDISGEQVPCSVRVEVDGISKTRNVKNTPPDCSQNANTSGPTPGENNPPVCSITSPVGSVVVNLGGMLDFSASATDPDGDALSFLWDFAGASDIRPTIASPTNIVFDQVGTFLVTLTVTDTNSARCNDTITVQVGDVPSNLPAKVSEEPAPGTSAAGNNQHVVLPYNDLGMHCGDLSSYPWSILPPFNTLHGQLIEKGSIGANKPVLLSNILFQLQYSAASNPNDPVGPGSINSTSQNYPVGEKYADATIKKSDFWDQLDADDTIVSALFGADVAPDTGLTGSTMPGILNPYNANNPQLFSAFDTEKKWFTGLGIPMIPVDDIGRLNSYPLMRVQGSDKLSGEILATTDIVLPVSSEVDCRDCHTKGLIAANQTAREGIENAPQFIDPVSPGRFDAEQAAKENIIILHNFKHGTTLLDNGKPVLCASCHASNALGTTGLDGVGNMSNVMHGQHGRFQVDGDGNLIRDATGEPILTDPSGLTGAEIPLIAFGPEIPMEENCFLCHPGKITQCFRGAMFSAGQQCEDCHGDMLAVGGEYTLNNGLTREPWVNEPRCESCHTGRGDDAVLTRAFEAGDRAANPLIAVNKRFSENVNTLYRDSLGHGGVGCEGCHGSPHAIWPNQDPNANDNVTAMQLQGHKGSIQECTVCHEQNSFPNGTLGGPHGMHPVNDPNWIKSKDDLWHEDYVKDEQGNDQCAACHGADHLGTRLSKVPVDRVLKDTDGVVRATLSAGEIVSCDLCHDLEKSFDN